MEIISDFKKRGDNNGNCKTKLALEMVRINKRKKVKIMFYKECIEGKKEATYKSSVTCWINMWPLSFKFDRWKK